MFEEITVSVGASAHKVFLQDGFYNKHMLSGKIHKHNYAEVHFILGDDTAYRVGDEDLVVKSGSMLVIPPAVYHAGVNKAPETLHVAFQIDAPVSEASMHSLPVGLIEEFFFEIDRCAVNEDYSGICAYIALFSRHFLASERVAERISDYGFLIYEFFSNRYSEDVHLSDLAEDLHLSERQAERLVIEHTGNSFRDELTVTRVNIARQLLETSDMTLAEVAGYVGYRSYAGFWKAMKRYQLL